MTQTHHITFQHSASLRTSKKRNDNAKHRVGRNKRASQKLGSSRRLITYAARKSRKEIFTEGHRGESETPRKF